MQRVLSFPPSSRGFGDPSEFVSKRMCFSFMFSLGFLAFLGGFLLGRFIFDQELELSRSKLKKAHLHHQQVFGVYKNYSQFDASSLVEGISETFLQEHLARILKLLEPLPKLASPSAEISFRRLVNESADSPGNLREAEILQNHLTSHGFDLVSPLVESQMHLSYPSSHSPNKAFIVDEKDNVILECEDTRQKHSEAKEAPVTSVVEGSIVYANFGRNEDYHYLYSLGIEVSGSVVLVRAGRIATTEMVSNALDHEAKGILVYLDPQQKDVQLPLLSPGDLAKLQILHGNHIDKWVGSIPVLEISSSDAEKIFKKMAATESSAESWRGKLKCSYPIGPGFATPEWKLRMEVSTVHTARTYFNVLGAMRGSQEPDRFVMLTNEKTLANDEQESTSIIMEIVRVLGELKKKGWRPHRSIVVAFWGLEGPNQFLPSNPDNLLSQLIRRAVTYLKVDSALSAEGNETLVKVTPVLEKLFHSSAKAASMVNPTADVMLPPITDNLYIQFGIPFLMAEQFKTKGNQTLKDLAVFWGVTAWQIAESHGLPFSLDSYAKFFSHTIQVIENRFKAIAQKHTLFLDTLFQSVQQLIAAIQSFEEKWSHADKAKSIEMRIMNDQLLDFTRSLICDRESISSANILSSRHLIFSKSLTGNDEKAGFGELQDLLREITSIRAPEDLHQQIVTHLAGLVECISLARYALTDGLETFITMKA